MDSIAAINKIVMNIRSMNEMMGNNLNDLYKMVKDLKIIEIKKTKILILDNPPGLRPGIFIIQPQLTAVYFLLENDII